MPYSSRNPQFNREPLKKVLKSHGIDYVFLGEEPGGKVQGPLLLRRQEGDLSEDCRLELVQERIGAHQTRQFMTEVRAHDFQTSEKSIG